MIELWFWYDLIGDYAMTLAQCEDPHPLMFSEVF